MINDDFREIIALIRDLDLQPRNYFASMYYDAVELEDFMRNRNECDMRDLHNRNYKRKKDVLAPYGYHVSGTLEL